MNHKPRLLYTGFHAGRYYRFEEGPFCYLNGSQFVKISQDPLSKQVKLMRAFVKVIQNEVFYQQIEEIDFGSSDEIRIYKEIRLGKDGLGSKPLEAFIPDLIMQTKNQGIDRFYLTFDYKIKKWKGKWGAPKLSRFSINQQGLVFVKTDETRLEQ